jgi:hypothetical protein
VIKKTCAVSGKEFEVTSDDVAFYEKIGVPIPTLCPKERQRRRFSWRNERTLYRKNCDLCKKSTIAIYDENAPFPVYCRECWRGDTWEAKTFGQEFDFSRPFFEQFSELLQKVPKLAVINDYSENSEFTHLAAHNRNCFLVTGSARCEDTLFVYRSFDVKDSIDCAFLLKGELCYQCLECEHLYECAYCVRCKNSRNLYVCYDCQNCKNCFGCTNLRNKEFYWGNKPLDPDEFFERLKKVQCSWKEFSALKKSGISRATKCIQCENCAGDNIEKSKNCSPCFDLSECEECRYCTAGTMNEHCFDVDFFDRSKWCWNGSSHELVNNCICCATVWYSNDIFYSENCSSSHDLFGCIGMIHAEYCILNKQYSKTEYFQLRDKIIEHMKKTDEWGKSFPIEMSPFAYNETAAQAYHPLSEKEAIARGYRWKKMKKKDCKPVTITAIPSDIQDVHNSITKEILACKTCKKNYQIQNQELKFYKKMNLPIPLHCVDCRHRERMTLRNSRTLYTRTCDKCSIEIQTTFAPDRPEKVYCEKCYLSSVE